MGPSQDDTCTRTDCPRSRVASNIARLGTRPTFVQAVCWRGKTQARGFSSPQVIASNSLAPARTGLMRDPSSAVTEVTPSLLRRALVPPPWTWGGSLSTPTKSRRPRNQYLPAYSAPQFIDALASNSFQQDGDTVCRSAAKTGYRCGVIKNHLVSKPNGQGKTITRVWVMDRDASGGDSGGIMPTKTFDQFLQTWIYRVAGFPCPLQC